MNNLVHFSVRCAIAGAAIGLGFGYLWGYIAGRRDGRAKQGGSSPEIPTDDGDHSGER